MRRTLIIVGAGALGSHVVMLIRNMGCDIRVIDFDRVESKNTLGQFHGRQGSGRNKAFSLQQAMAGMWGVKIDAVPHRLTRDNLGLLGDADLIVDCTDNGEARSLILAGAGKTPVLHGCLAADGSFGRAMWNEHGFRIDAEDQAGQATCEGGEHLPFHALVASLVAGAVQQFLQKGLKVSLQATPTGVQRLA